jgi:DNA-damage-inducible protein D
MEQKNLTPFEGGEKIRKVWHREEWWFSIIDVIQVLTDSASPKTYWGMMKKRESQPFTNCEQLKMIAHDGKNRLTDCANTEGVLRIVMSIPSPKAEPLKQWMAQVSTERIEETENPELGFERLTEIYKSKGYTDEWIERRIEAHKARKRLTDEWQNRGILEKNDYSILTAVIAKGTFGLTPSEHSDLKGIGNKNLRDHMTPLELIFTALGEEVTRSLAIKEDAQGFNENHDVAVQGGRMAGKFRKETEAKGVEVVSKKNYLKESKQKNLPNDDAEKKE